MLKGEKLEGAEDGEQPLDPNDMSF